jgi:Restriction endonuclease
VPDAAGELMGLRADRTVPGGGHGAVLAAIRTLLADGKAYSAEELCALGIEHKLLAPATIPNYVRNAIKTLLDRQRDRGEKPEFVLLRDGRYRLDMPVDAFAGHDDPEPSNPAIEALIASLQSSAYRRTPAQPGDGPNIGAPFERDVAAAFGALGFRAKRMGGEGEPDVVATAPLGDRAYTVVVECKTVATAENQVRNPAAQEAGRLRDAVGGDYAVLLGPDFARAAEVDGELQTHRVALWTCEDLIELLRTHAVHAIRWSLLVPLFAPGRASGAIAEFTQHHVHGDRKRAHVAYRYVLEEGLAYQELLANADPQVHRTVAPLTVEALAVLVNERLAHENELGRVSLDDIRRAVAYGAHPLVDTLSLDGDRVTIEARWLERPTRTSST